MHKQAGMLGTRIIWRALGLSCALAPLWAGVGQAAEEDGAEEPSSGAEINFPALPEPVIAFYVPPTRSAHPIAATSRAIYAHDRGDWRAIHKSPGGESILGVAGYAKSSQPVYAARTGALARSRDGGASWEESTPIGYGAPTVAPEKFIGLAVNPSERKTCVVAFAEKAWATENYGVKWSELTLPSAAESISGVGFAGGDSPQLVLATSRALYASSNLGRSWSTLARSDSGPGRLTVAGGAPLAVTHDGKVLRAYDLTRPGYHLDRAAPGGAAVALSVDWAGRGLATYAAGGKLRAISLREPQATKPLDLGSSAPGALLGPHPRQPDMFFASAGSSLRLLRVPLDGGAEGLAASIPPEAFAQGAALAAVNLPTAARPENTELGKAQTLLSEVMGGQAPLEEAISAAMAYANYGPEETRKWKAMALAGKFLPKLQVQAGSGEVSFDRSNPTINIDRFGTPLQTSIRQNDGFHSADNYRVGLEWDLSKLLFNPDQVRIGTEERRRSMERNLLIAKVTQLYFDRTEMLVDRKLNEDTLKAPDLIKIQLKIAETTGILNGLCGRELFKN